MILGLAVLRGIRFWKDSDLFERTRLDTDLFLYLPNQGITGSLAPLAMSSDDIPDTRVEGSPR